VEPFRVVVTDAEIADLRHRLSHVRWPDQLPGSGWTHGTDRTLLRELCEHWRDVFDWSALTDRMNAWPQFLTTIDGQRIHFIHARSPEPQARPLIISHGWPGSVAEFTEVIGPLVDPVAHGGDAADAFHIVCPSLPGYGFSGPTTEPGWTVPRIADAFVSLMTRLGYDRFFAQGGDWGSGITNAMAARSPEHVAAIHLNLVTVGPPKGVDDPMDGVTERERTRLDRMRDFHTNGAGYMAIQSTKPQTLAYGLTDSPAGLAGWMLEKFQAWSDCDGDVRNRFTFDQLLDHISIYWLTGTIHSSMRLYYESAGPGRAERIPHARVPMGHTVFPMETYAAPRRWVESVYDVVYWSEQDQGGHFAAMEVPELFVDEVRSCFRRCELQ